MIQTEENRPAGRFLPSLSNRTPTAAKERDVELCILLARRSETLLTLLVEDLLRRLAMKGEIERFVRREAKQDLHWLFFGKRVMRVRATGTTRRPKLCE